MDGDGGGDGGKEEGFGDVSVTGNDAYMFMMLRGNGSSDDFPFVRAIALAPMMPMMIVTLVTPDRVVMMSTVSLTMISLPQL